MSALAAAAAAAHSPASPLPGILLILTGLVLWALTYSRSLRKRPFVPCRVCEGGGKDRDPIWTKAWGLCRACNGTGRKPRLGLRLIAPDEYRKHHHRTPR